MNRHDCIAEASIGIITAAERYNPELGKFSTYAFFWARQRLYTSIKQQLRQIGMVRTSKSPQLLSMGLEPSDDILYDYRSLNTARTIHGLERFDDILSMIDSLPERQTDMIKRYYGILCQRMNLRQIGEIHNISRERIRQLIKISIIAIRNKMSGISSKLDNFNARPWPGVKALNSASMRTIGVIEDALLNIDGEHTMKSMIETVATLTKLKPPRISRTLRKGHKIYFCKGRINKVRCKWCVDDEWKRLKRVGSTIVEKRSIQIQQESKPEVERK
jgi:RNA polymerase sigma factor (sigma-70 family)